MPTNSRFGRLIRAFVLEGGLLKSTQVEDDMLDMASTSLSIGTVRVSDSREIHDVIQDVIQDG